MQPRATSSRVELPASSGVSRHFRAQPRAKRYPARMHTALAHAIGLTPLPLLTLALACPAQEQERVYLPGELKKLVDLPTTAARQKRADELAGNKNVSIGLWLTAMKAFGQFADEEAGTTRHSETLQVGSKREETEIFVHVPEAYDPKAPAPLMVMLHGTGSNGRDLEQYWQQVSKALGMIVICPSEAGPNGGYAYKERERQSGLAVIRWTRRKFNIDENRIFLAGISRGGHMTWDLALRYPDLAAAIVPMIGGPRLNTIHGQNNLRYLPNIVDLPIRDLQGMKDDPGLIFNLHLAFDKLKKLGARDAKLLEYPDLGHSFRMNGVPWVDWLGKARRNPFPAKITRISACKGEGRAFWAEILSTNRKVQENFGLRVSPAKWNRMSADEQRLLAAREAEKKSASLVLERRSPEEIKVTLKHVTHYRILLSEDMIPEKGKITIKQGARTTKRTIKRSKTVLLREFAERFDRSFLPTAELRY